MIYLRQSTASQEILLGMFMDETDGTTPLNSLSINASDIKIFKAGATAEVSKNSGGATYVGNPGKYYAVLDATDTNTLGSGEINVHVAGALPVRREFCVLPAVVYDAMILGTDLLQVDVWQVVNVNTDYVDIDGANCLVVDATRIGGQVPQMTADGVFISNPHYIKWEIDTDTNVLTFFRLDETTPDETRTLQVNGSGKVIGNNG